MNYYATEIFFSDIISPYFRINMDLPKLLSRYGSKDIFSRFLSTLSFFMSFVCSRKTFKAEEVKLLEPDYTI